MNDRIDAETVSNISNLYDDVYSKHTYQEYIKTVQSNDTFFQKIMKRKWWVIGAVIGGMAGVGLVVGLPLYYSKFHDITNSTIANLTSSISTKITKTSTLSTTMSPSSITISPITTTSTTTSPKSTTTSPTLTSPTSTTISPPSPNESSTSFCIWTSWVDASRCHFDQKVGNGFRNRSRCFSTQNDSDNLDTCNDDQDVMECSPRECTDVQCNCNLSSESFGLKNGTCSGKTFEIFFNVRWDHLSKPAII